MVAFDLKCVIHMYYMCQTMLYRRPKFQTTSSTQPLQVSNSKVDIYTSVTGQVRHLHVTADLWDTDGYWYPPKWRNILSLLSLHWMDIRCDWNRARYAPNWTYFWQYPLHFFSIESNSLPLLKSHVSRVEGMTLAGSRLRRMTPSSRLKYR